MIERLTIERADEVLDLYHSAFEKPFRDPDDEVIEDLRGSSLRRSTYRIDGILLNERVAGMVRWRFLESLPATFIVHLAVDPQFRKHGLGDQLLSWPRVQHPEVPLLLEVEHANPHDPDDHRRECERRLAWFSKRGAHRLTPSYTQPALYPDTEPQPLNLLAIGPAPNVHELIERFYSEVWGLPSDHPFVVRALAGADV